MEEDKFKDKDMQRTPIIKLQEIEGASTNSCKQSKSKPAVASTSAIKPKKSKNILSALVRRTRKKKITQPENVLEPENVSSQNMQYIESNTTVGHAEEEVEICVENLEKKLEVGDTRDVKQENLLSMEKVSTLTTDSEQSIPSIKTKSPFFHKFKKKHAGSEASKKKSDLALAVQTSILDISESLKNLQDSCTLCEICEHERLAGQSEEISWDSHVPSSIVNFGKPPLNITLANGLHAVQDLVSRLHESESHLMQILGKYIRDEHFHKELVDTLCQHAKLQWDTERRTTALANDMWMQQLEIGRTQERTLQETLNSLVKQNRQLQIDHEIMFRKHEKLIKKLRTFPEIAIKYKPSESGSQEERILKQHEKLQYKLEAYCQHIENIENELHVSKTRNDCLEQQLRGSSQQIQNLKAVIQRSRTDYELELVTLNCKLNASEEIIKESVEAGDVLLEDLNGLKRQFKNYSFAMNWSKYKCRGSSLIDLIHMSRSCISELSKELINAHNLNVLKDKDIENLRETNGKLQENLKKSTTELDNLSKKLDENSYREADKIVSEQKCKLLESDLKHLEDKIEKLKETHEMEKTALQNTVRDYQNLNAEILEKNRLIEQSKQFISSITAENLALRTQVDGLNRILSESGAGDVVQELATSQEQVAYFQSEYYQLIKKEQYLAEQLTRLKTDNKIITESQEKNLKQLQRQLQAMDKTAKENNFLKHQYEAEHQTVLSLQNERMKYLEEKNMLKTIFQHMKSEISRVQKLEATVTDISKEASKLAMIAEYNKQLGEKLKTEISQKDRTILQLKTSVEQLNDIQIKNTKEKLSLCYELSEVCQIKEQLNSILSVELQRNMDLDDSKKEIAKTATNQIKKYEEVYKNERSALKEILRDYKLVVHHRDAAVKEKEKLKREISQLHIKFQEHLKKCDGMVYEKNANEVKISQLSTKLDEDKSLISQLKEQLSNEVANYENNVNQLEKLIYQLREEKEGLLESVKFLQNNNQSLLEEVEQSKKEEKAAKDMLKQCLTAKEVLEKEKEAFQMKSNLIKEEKENLLNEIHYLNTLCDKILSDFESSIKASVEKEELLRKEINESKVLLFNHAREIGNLSETLKVKQEELKTLSKECETLRITGKKYNELVTLTEKQKSDVLELKNKKIALEEFLDNLQTDYGMCKEHLQTMKEKYEKLRNQLNSLVEEKEDYLLYKKQINEELRKNEELQENRKNENRQLKAELNDISQKLENERASYATLSQIHKEVSAKFLKSIKDVVDEKNSKQELATLLKQTKDELETLKTQKGDLQKQCDMLLDGLNEEKNRINVLSLEKQNIQNLMADLQKRYNEILSKCMALENEVRKADVKIDNETKGQLRQHMEQIEHLKREIQENHDVMFVLKEDIAKLQQQVTGIEFTKSEVTLRLHETQRKLETEQKLGEQLKNTHKLILAAVLKMKEDGKVDPCDCSHLLHMARSSATQTKCDLNNTDAVNFDSIS